jgi:hypothetical protein
MLVVVADSGGRGTPRFVADEREYRVIGAVPAPPVGAFDPGIRPVSRLDAVLPEPVTDVIARMKIPQPDLATFSTLNVRMGVAVL